VRGISCISPRAPAWLFASGWNSLSCRVSPYTTARSTGEPKDFQRGITSTGNP
jgi:hypothetical protein